MFFRQMLVIIGAPAESLSSDRSARLPPDLMAGLDDLFQRTGFVHFATTALLPPGPEDDPWRTPVRMMLELAVDARMPPDEVLTSLAALDGRSKALSSLFAVAQSSQADPAQALTDFLRRHCSQASGGFVGNRDRTVAQIHAEAHLFSAVRQHLRSYRSSIDAAATSTDLPPDTATIAAEMSGWAGLQPELQALRSPAPRGWWRRRWMTGPIRLVLTSIATVLPALIALIGLFGLSALLGVIAIAAAAVLIGPEVFDPIVFGPFSGSARMAVGFTVLLAIMLAMIFAVWVTRTLISSASFAMLIVLTVLFFMSGGLSPDYRGAMGVLMGWGLIVGVGSASLLFAVLMALMLSLLITPRHLGAGALVGVCGGLLVMLGVGVHGLLSWLVANPWPWYADLAARIDSLRLPFGLPGADAFWLIVSVILILIAILLQPAIQGTGWAARRAFAGPLPAAPPIEGAMQTHRAIEACEAALVGRQNHMMSLTEIRRPYWLYGSALTLSLWLIGWIGHVIYVNGRLGNAQGIHFGHWHVIDGRRRLLFLSNYDGSFGGYLDDFILGAMPGVNLIWRWTELRRRSACAPGQPAVRRDRAFPDTHWLVFRGCRREQWFKTYARDSMLAHQYRFEAYPQSCNDIERATRLRDALAGPRDTVNDDLIMRTLES